MGGLDGMWRVLRAGLAATIASFVLAANGFAAALVQDVKGDVRTEAAVAVEKGQQILTGATLTTGPNSQAILAFDDGQQVVLNENTQFRITDYQFTNDNPQADRSFFSLLRGAARVVTGVLAQRSRASFEFRTPTSTIGVRGTDFMLAIVNQPSYLSVLQGQIAATNTAGTVTFGAGTFGVISAANVLAVAITAAALPAAAAAAFSSLGAVAVSAGVVTGAAGGATGGAAAAAGVGAGVGAAVVAGGVAAAAAVTASGGGGGGGGGGTTAVTPSASPAVGNWHGIVTVIANETAGPKIGSATCSIPWNGTVDSSRNFSGTTTSTTCNDPTGLSQAINGISFGPIAIASDGSATLPLPVSGTGSQGTVTFTCSSWTLRFASTSVSTTSPFSCTVSGTTAGTFQASASGTSP